MPPKLSNDRALRIVVAARDEFARRGLAGARVEQIARRAGVNKQLLFYYYHSNRGLFQAVLAEAAGELEAALSNLALPSGVPPAGRRRGAGAARAPARSGRRLSCGRSERALAPPLMLRFRRSDVPIRSAPLARPDSAPRPGPRRDAPRASCAPHPEDPRDRARS